MKQKTKQWVKTLPKEDFKKLESYLKKETKSWLISILLAVFVAGLAIFTLLGAGLCNYARFYDVHACTIGGVK